MSHRQRIEARADLNCFTTVLETPVAEGEGPLSGTTFAAKDLFDVAGHITLAGSTINRDTLPPATQDATLVARLKAAGSVLVGMTNMDEYAYGFATENAHYGPTRNPHDPSRLAGGSSGGSAAAVAAGLVDVALGSDTNGSIRVPASLCGIYGLKPTFGRLSRAGVFPFVHSLDHAGLFTRDPALMAKAYDAMLGPDSRDPVCSKARAEPVSPALHAPLPPLRVGVLGGFFAQGAAAEAHEAVAHVAQGLAELGCTIAPALLDGASQARSAAFCMTAMEGGSLHAANLRARPLDFDPAVRDRMLAGLLMPADLHLAARRVRRIFADQARAAFAQFDLLLSPATPCSAPQIGVPTVEIDGQQVPVRANLGMYCQPISFIGLPALSVPALCDTPLPIGVQMIAPAWAEARLLHVAVHLHAHGITGTRPIPSPPQQDPAP
ncbi:AtzE family amidohydrolase [Novosphingobium umbonatum]|uniref:AtzE family amidohydrolase n=1 Tax=Novosphingobium umbonatum TaxID=1908524 RepID=A0A437NCQ2_9SPHN|nr:AtzE family amidohydrolase [Novosphingobium umbonatum]RVU07738.1 AtzE family amidohydrolase [Novosphingobium umbonatum]